MSKASCIVGSLVFCLVISVLSVSVMAGTSTTTLNGNQYYWTGGDTGPSSAYPSIGIKLSPGSLSGGGAAWQFTIDTAPRTYSFYVTLYYTDNSWLGDGPDILMYNWTADAWDTIETAMGKGTNIYRTASPAALGYENFISTLGHVDVEAWAGALDDTDVGTISIAWSYDDTPPSNPTSSTTIPTVNTWTTDNTIEVQWSGAADNMNGIGGYSLQWTQSPTTVPDATVNTTGTSVTSSPLADGSWYLHIRTVDGVDNWNSGAYHVGPFKIDTTAPASPTVTTGPPTWSNQSTPQFTWSSPSDLSGIAGYSYSYDNPPDNSIDTTSLSAVLPSLGQGTHQFYVKACDLADNWGLPSLYSFSLDFASPTLTISSPVESAIQNSSSLSVSWTGSDALSGINHYEVQLDSGTLVNVGTSSSRSFSSVPDGRHVINVRAIDNAMNIAQGIVNVTVDTVAPATSASIAGTEGLSGWFVSTVTVTLVSSDATTNVNFTRYSIGSGGWSDYTGGFSITDSGVYVVTYYSQDVAGNRNPTSTSTIKLDLEPPSLTFTDQKDGVTFTSKSVAIAWSSTDNESGISHYEYKLDSSSYQSVASTSTVGLSDLSDGQHTLTVRAIDNAGNIAEKSLTFSIDTNVFSLKGPAGPWLDVGLIIVIIAVAILAVLLFRRRKRVASTKSLSEEQKPAT